MAWGYTAGQFAVHAAYTIDGMRPLAGVEKKDSSAEILVNMSIELIIGFCMPEYATMRQMTDIFCQVRRKQTMRCRRASAQLLPDVPGRCGRRGFGCQKRVPPGRPQPTGEKACQKRVACADDVLAAAACAPYSRLASAGVDDGSFRRERDDAAVGSGNGFSPSAQRPGKTSEFLPVHDAHIRVPREACHFKMRVIKNRIGRRKDKGAMTPPCVPEDRQSKIPIATSSVDAHPIACQVVFQPIIRPCISRMTYKNTARVGITNKSNKEVRKTVMIDEPRCIDAPLLE